MARSSEGAAHNKLELAGAAGDGVRRGDGGGVACDGAQRWTREPHGTGWGAAARDERAREWKIFLREKW